MWPRSERARPRPMVVAGPRPSPGSRTTSPRRAPTRAAPARSSSWRASSSASVRASRSVSSWRVVRSDTQPASRSWSRAPGALGAVSGVFWVFEEGPGGVSVAAGAGATVCAGEGTVESIPATFGGCGAFMASGFPTGAYCSKASQTPMSFCAAGSVSTCTRTREGMSSIVLPGFLVSMGLRVLFRSPLADWQSWLKTASGDGPLRSTGFARRSVTAVVMGTYSEKARGGWGPPGTW